MARVLALVLLVSVLAMLPMSASGSERAGNANVQFIWNLPAPVMAVAGSLDGAHVAVLDENALFTFILDEGARQREWQTPSSGYLGLLAEALAEVPPLPVGLSMTPDGKHWAGAVRYDDSFPGRLYGFAHWSDEPIWRYGLPSPSLGQSAVRFTSVDSGGGIHAAGTTDGRVLMFRAGDEGSVNKSPYVTYREDNKGNRFGQVSDVALSRDGGLVLIGTQATGNPTVHLFTDSWFKLTVTRITAAVEQVAIAPEAPRGVVVTGTGENTRIHFLDLDTGRTIWERTIGAAVRDLALSADGTLLAVGTGQGRVLLFEERGDLMDSDPRRTFTFQGQVDALGVADDARAVAVATSNGDLHFLDARRAAALWSYDLGSPMRALALSGDAEVIAVGAKHGDEGRVVYATAKHDLAHMVPPAPRLLPGPDQSIAVELANNGNRMARVEVDWRVLPDGWVGLESNITLAPGEQGKLLAKLDLPRGQRADDYELVFDLVAGAKRVPVELNVRVPEVTMGRTVTVWGFDHAVPGGGPAAFLFRLENLGNTPNHIAVGYSGLPAGWKAEFTGQTEMRLSPGEDRQIALTLRAPHDAQKWRDISFDLVVAWQQGEERVPLTVAVVDHAEYEALVLAIMGEKGGPKEDGVEALMRVIEDGAKRGVSADAAQPFDGRGIMGFVIAAGVILFIIAALVALVAVLGWRRARRREDRLNYVATREKTAPRAFALDAKRRSS